MATPRRPSAAKSKPGTSAAPAVTRAMERWDDVRFFLAIHRAGSLSAAAKPLRVTQPTCGRRLATFERTLGFRLFDRTPDGLRITKDGEALLVAATAMEHSAAQLVLRAAATDRDLEGVVRVAANELFVASFLVDAVGDLRARHPKIRFEFVIGDAEADLVRREADIAFRFRPLGMRPSQDVLVAQKLGDEPFALFGTDEYVRRRGASVDAYHLAGHDIVACTGGHPAARWCEAAFRGANVVLATSTMHACATAIAAGLGVGVLPCRAIAAFPRLRALSGTVTRATGWLVVHPELRALPRIRLVVDEWSLRFRGQRTT